jgi:hypothetical protein
MDHRIIDFRAEHVLPEEFVAVEPKRMIYACGDGYGGFTKAGNALKKTNIEMFSKIGFNVFCCLYKNDANINYLMANPELNVVLCIITGDPRIDNPIFVRLFAASLSVICTDDTRFYPSAQISFALLKVGGICDRVHLPYHVVGTITGGRIYSGDPQWGPPNFALVKLHESNHHVATFQKSTAEFNSAAKYKNTTEPNTSKNNAIARKLAEMYFLEEARRERSWANWRARHTKPKGGRRRCRITRKL